MAVAAHIAAAADAFAKQAVTGESRYIGIDAAGTVHTDLHGADVVTFKTSTDPMCDALDVKNMDRNFTSALVKRNKTACDGGDTEYVCVLDNISTLSTCAELQACSDRRCMFPRIMLALLSRLPPEFTAVCTGVITSSELAAKLAAETPTDSGYRFKLSQSILYCYRDA